MSANLARLGDPNLAFWLTRSVARAMKINLSDALQDGTLSAVDYSAMVTRCRMCPHVETCHEWLAVNGAGTDRAPVHCQNADQLNGLAAGRRSVRV